MEFKRKGEQKDNPNTNKHEQIVPEQQGEQTLRDSLTKTDKTFYDRAMKDFGEPYYHFQGTLKKNKCGFCGKAYSTNLTLNKYCSYQHYRESLSGAPK